MFPAKTVSGAHRKEQLLNTVAFVLAMNFGGRHCKQMLEKQGARITRMGGHIEDVQGKTPEQTMILDVFVFGINITPLAVGLAVGLHLPRFRDQNVDPFFHRNF